MTEPAKFNHILSFVWATADFLSRAFQQSEFQKTILPFPVLQRLDNTLEQTKAKVLEKEASLKAKGRENGHRQLCCAATFSFYNIAII